MMVFQQPSGMLPDIHKIAVLRANALGDFIFCLPALTALKATYPQAEIVLLARGWHQKFWANRPGPVDRVLVIPEGGIGQESEIGQDPEEVVRFFAAMRAEKFDLAIQMHGGGRNSNPFTLNLEARTTIGLCTPDALLLDRWIPYIHYQSEVIRFLELVALVGARPDDVEPRIQITAADLAEAEAIVPEGRSGLDQAIVALHPGATDSRRRWPTEKFAAVGDALASQGAQVFVTGTEPERPLVEAVVNQMQTKAGSLCGRLSLNGLAGFLSRCSVVVTNDSGPMHLATAVGSATVGIYWCGNVITAGIPGRSFHRPAISWRLNCPVCGVDCTQAECNHQESFVADVTVEEVLESAIQLLEFRRILGMGNGQGVVGGAYSPFPI
ncbi:MAG: glycosyltransferase family 9 protein [Leptolyngbyaceae cyanobacterium bins.59]|nr:glycosyltransferase family 9 protein [Leptolyngbyaceae cyanobacterium bins.59]